jgi:hypothetical protein
MAGREWTEKVEIATTMESRGVGPTPFVPRKGIIMRPGRSSVTRIPTDGQASMQYFSQILDTETVCVNALRALRAENAEDSKWIASLREDEWMFKCTIPIPVKY